MVLGINCRVSCIAIVCNPFVFGSFDRGRSSLDSSSFVCRVDR